MWSKTESKFTSMNQFQSLNITNNLERWDILMLLAQSLKFMPKPEKELYQSVSSCLDQKLVENQLSLRRLPKEQTCSISILFNISLIMVSMVKTMRLLPSNWLNISILFMLRELYLKISLRTSSKLNISWEMEQLLLIASFLSAAKTSAKKEWLI